MCRAAVGSASPGSSHSRQPDIGCAVLDWHETRSGIDLVYRSPTAFCIEQAPVERHTITMHRTTRQENDNSFSNLGVLLLIRCRVARSRALPPTRVSG